MVFWGHHGGCDVGSYNDLHRNPLVYMFFFSGFYGGLMGFYGGLMGSNGILPSGKLTVCYGRSTNVS